MYKIFLKNLIVISLIIYVFPISAHAASTEDFDFSELNKILQEDENEEKFSFEELVNLLLAGNFAEIGSQFKKIGISCLLSSVEKNQIGLQRVLLLTLILAIYSILASAFSKNTIPETGFYITYLLLIVLLIQSFEAAWQTANTLIQRLFDFSAALLPAFILAVAYSGNQTAAMGYYQMSLVVLASMEWIFFKVFIPVIHIYLILSLLNEIAEEGYFTGLLKMLGKGINNTQKYLMTAVTGLQLIQGLILPQVDIVKNQAVLKAVAAIPGVGSISQSISSTLLGSGVLIRNGIGVAAIICLLTFCIVPFMQMAVMSIMYHLSAALVAPIADKRVTACISKTAEGIGLLIKITFSALTIFIILIAGICIMTGNGA